MIKVFIIVGKRLHDDVLNISKKPLRAHLAVFFPFVRQKHPVFFQRCVWRQGSSLVNHIYQPDCHLAVEVFAAVEELPFHMLETGKPEEPFPGTLLCPVAI